MKINHLQGLIAAPFTPFHPDGSLHLQMVPKLAQVLKNNGVQGAFICGTTGEGAALTFDEKKALISEWSKCQTDDFRVIVMLSGTNQREAISLAKFAESQKLYGTALTAPYYFRTSGAGQLVDYLKPVADAAPGLPMYFYHIPLLTKVEHSMIELLEIADREIPNFAGIKYTHNDLMEFNRCLRFQNGKFDILWGWDETFLAGLSFGAKAAVGSTYNYAAPLYHKIFKAFEQGNMDIARQYQQQSIDFISLFAKYGGPAAGKAIMEFCGMDCGNFRAPVQALSSQKKDEFRQDLETQKFFDFAVKV